MCLIVFAWRPDHAQPLIVAANRDEFYARPSLPLAQWPETPQVHAGRDQEGKGNRLGIGAHGRFAALTNIRDPHRPPRTQIPRLNLVARFLTGEVPIDDYLAEVVARSPEYTAASNRWWATCMSCGTSTPELVPSCCNRESAEVECQSGYTVAEAAQGQRCVERSLG